MTRTSRRNVFHPRDPLPLCLPEDHVSMGAVLSVI